MSTVKVLYSKFKAMLPVSYNAQIKNHVHDYLIPSDLRGNLDEKKTLKVLWNNNRQPLKLLVNRKAISKPETATEKILKVSFII